MSYDELENIIQSQRAEIEYLNTEVAGAKENFRTLFKMNHDLRIEQANDQEQYEAKVKDLREEVGSLRARLLPIPCDVGVQCNIPVAVTSFETQTDEIYPDISAVAVSVQTDDSWKPTPAPRIPTKSVQCQFPDETKNGSVLSISDSCVNLPSRTGVKLKTRPCKEASTATGNANADTSGSLPRQTLSSSSDSDQESGYYRPPHLREKMNSKKRRSAHTRRGNYGFTDRRRDQSSASSESNWRQNSNYYRHKKPSLNQRYNAYVDCYNYSDDNYYSRDGSVDDIYWYVSTAISEMLYYFMPVF